jgi:hypothetical protein
MVGFGSNGDSFVQQTMEVFDADSFAIATSSNMDFEIQNGADGLEKTLKVLPSRMTIKPQNPNFKRISWTRRQARLWAITL